MIRKQAMKIVLEQIDSSPIISANGFMSRDLFELKEKNSNFYPYIKGHRMIIDYCSPMP